jgi:hypothetical protein
VHEETGGAQVRVQFKKALALRSEIRRAGGSSEHPERGDVDGGVDGSGPVVWIGYSPPEVKIVGHLPAGIWRT